MNGINQKIEWPYPLCVFSILSMMSGVTDAQLPKKIPTIRWV